MNKWDYVHLIRKFKLRKKKTFRDIKITYFYGSCTQNVKFICETIRKNLEKVSKNWKNGVSRKSPKKVKKGLKKGPKHGLARLWTRDFARNEGGPKKRVFLGKTDIDRKFFLIFTFCIFFKDLFIKLIYFVKSYYIFISLW